MDKLIVGALNLWLILDATIRYPTDRLTFLHPLYPGLNREFFSDPVLTAIKNTVYLWKLCTEKRHRNVSTGCEFNHVPVRVYGKVYTSDISLSSVYSLHYAYLYDGTIEVILFRRV